MKKLFFIALMAVAVSGCTALRSQQVKIPSPVIGLNVDEFKAGYPRAELIYLSNDSANYKITVANNSIYWADNVYHFYKGKLAKFEQKTHFFNTSTVKIEEVKK